MTWSVGACAVGHIGDPVTPSKTSMLTVPPNAYTNNRTTLTSFVDTTNVALMGAPLVNVIDEGELYLTIVCVNIAWT